MYIVEKCFILFKVTGCLVQSPDALTSERLSQSVRKDVDETKNFKTLSVNISVWAG